MKRSKSDQGTFDQKRRSFLKLTGLLGIGAAGTALLPVEQAEAVLFGKKEYRVSRTRTVMGTYVTMTAIDSSRDKAEQGIGNAFEKIDTLTALLSRYDESSPVYVLNRDGVLKECPQELLEVVARAIYFHQQTDGAFDITVKPIVDLYRERFAAGQKPTDAEIEAVLGRVGTGQLRFSGGTISFAREGMGITLDGIAKGYIVDRASEILTEQGLTNHLINAGGDIVTRGVAANGKPWTVAIQDPNKKAKYPDVIQMANGAIATSGNYEIFYDKEKLFHHIVDSRTGHSPHQAESVSIMASTVMDADALATGIFVMEPAQGINLVEKMAGYSGLLVKENGDTLRTSGWTAEQA